jgi:protein-S-isoprenylcysteine O-methyltransferase Ste14
MSVWRHLRAIGLLPFVATVVVPGVLVWHGDDVHVGAPALLGALLIAVGVGLFAWTVALFEALGEGTLAPWDPTSKLVVRGPYRHVRNPMITGVLAILLGEAAVLGMPALLEWAAIFLAANALWMPLVEEPGLRRRFGSQYDVYAANVPRWLPRLRPWRTS